MHLVEQIIVISGPPQSVGVLELLGMLDSQSQKVHSHDLFIIIISCLN